MMGNRYVRIVFVLGMVAVICGMVSAAVGVGVEPHETSGVEAPVCTAPCECMAESMAAAQWGVDGYDRCSKTVCGQSADAMVQYYCFHKVESTVPAATKAPEQAPVSGTAIPASPAAAGTPRESPVGIATILAGIGAALIAAAGTRRK